MDFLVLSRAATQAVGVDDDALNETHWSYMDRFAGSMIARGPTLAADRETWTGSVHVLALPDVEAARGFVAEEPYNRAGLYEEHAIWLFQNELGRTMWEFAASGVNEPRFLVIAEGSVEPVALADLSTPLRDLLILYGTLRSEPNGPPVGVALAIQAPTRAAADALAHEAISPRARVQVHDWEFGGRR
jgi:uncharacterized protein YciI